MQFENVGSNPTSRQKWKINAGWTNGERSGVGGVGGGGGWHWNANYAKGGKDARKLSGGQIEKRRRSAKKRKLIGKSKKWRTSKVSWKGKKKRESEKVREGGRMRLKWGCRGTNGCFVDFVGEIRRGFCKFSAACLILQDGQWKMAGQYEIQGCTNAAGRLWAECNLQI